MFVPVAASPFRATTASFSRISQHQGFRRHALRTHVRWLAAVAHNAKPKKLKTLACNTATFLRTS
jgi:DNA polymerase gamma 1